MKQNLYNNNKNIVGKIIKKRRETLKLSRDKLSAKLALLGITLYGNDIFLIENNKRTIRDFELIAICRILAIDCGELNNCINIEEELN